MAKQKPAAAEPAEPEKGVQRLINEKDLKALLRTCASFKNQTDELVGELREKIAFAVDKKHLDKKAFADLRRLDRMDDEDLARHWDTLLAYMDMAGVTKRIEAVLELPLEGTGKKRKNPRPFAAAVRNGDEQIGRTVRTLAENSGAAPAPQG